MKESKNASNNVAEKNAQPPFDATAENHTEAGLSITHEQVSDTYTEGTIDQKSDDQAVKEAQEK